MLKRSIEQTPVFIAGDNTLIREVLHPKNEAGVALPYSLAYATLPPGAASAPHILQSSSELYVFVKGQGSVHIDEESSPVAGGQVVLVPAGARQHVVNEGEVSLEFWCIVSPPWAASDELVL